MSAISCGQQALHNELFVLVLFDLNYRISCIQLSAYNKPDHHDQNRRTGQACHTHCGQALLELKGDKSMNAPKSPRLENDSFNLRCEP